MLRTAALRCAREAGKSLRAMDRCGVVDTVCSYCVPVLIAFGDMPVNECFAFYHIILRHTLREALKVHDIYVDIACRLAASFERYIGLCQAAEQAAYAASRDIRMLVNWVHANGHDEPCQLDYSGRMAPGAAMRIGAAAEQLWSQFRVWVPGMVRVAASIS
jgi:hypothetical protein